MNAVSKLYGWWIGRDVVILLMEWAIWAMFLLKGLIEYNWVLVYLTFIPALLLIRAITEEERCSEDS